jgi:hypothetical protein
MSAASGAVSTRYETIIAVLIAMTAVLGAVAAWRAADAAASAGNANLAGLAAVLATEEVRALANAEHYQGYQAYTTYRRHSSLANGLDRDLSRALAQRSTAAQVQERQRDDERAMAEVARAFFDVRYLTTDDGFDKERDLGATLAETGREKQLNSTEKLEESERFRSKVQSFIGTLIVLSVAGLLYTIAQGMTHGSRYALVVLGSILLLTGSAALAATEWLA